MPHLASPSCKTTLYLILLNSFVAVHLFNCWVVFNSLWSHELYSRPGFPVLYYLPEFAHIYVHWVPNAIQISHPLVPLAILPSIFPSIRGFLNELALHIRWPTYWSLSSSISQSNEYSGQISFRIDWFDLLTVQGTLKSLLQYYSLKASILWQSAFLMVQLSHPYMTARKTIAFTIWTFVTKVMFLLFNRLPRFVIACLPRSKHLLISWLQSPSAVPWS